MEFLRTRTRYDQVFPSPENGAVVEENPPCLCWLLQNGVALYRVEVKNAAGQTVFTAETDKNYVVPTGFLPAETYIWNVHALSAEGTLLCSRGEESFSVSEQAVRFVRPTAQEIFDAVPAERPRHIFCREDIPALLTRRTEIEVLQRNIALALPRPMPQRPLFHRDEQALPYREYFGLYRDDCDRDLVACALGYALLGDAAAGAHAKELFLTICDWNPEGPCALTGQWGDEVGLSNARCLPAVFDLLYPLLDEKQRLYAAKTVAAYAQQCEDRLRRLNYCQNPGDSHAGRLPAYMGEAAMVLKGTGAVPEEILLRWLAYAVDIYGGIFPFYGSSDGGWAEGAFYSTSYTKWYLPFFCAVERYTGKSFLSRPFYQRYTQYLLHFADPAYENHPFCDGYWCHPADREWAGFFAQNPFRVYAKRFGPALAQKKDAACSHMDCFLLHLLDVFIPDGKAPAVHLTGEVQNVQGFLQTGFAGMHTNLADPAHDYAVLCRASRFGPGSHRHADQGSFAYFYKGKALVSPSGYFGRAYGSQHHVNWTRTTKAHNVCLLNGKGQTTAYTEGVRILSCTELLDRSVCEMTLSGAYGLGETYLRTVTLYPDGALEITDRISCPEETEVTFPLHFLSPAAVQGLTATVRHEGITLTVQPVAGLQQVTYSEAFDTDLNAGVPEPYRVTMPEQYHVYYLSPKAREHCITVRFNAQ